MNKIMISLSLLLQLSLAARNTRYVEYRPPVVFPNQDFLTVSARLNITLTCEGHKSVNWFLPTGSNSIGDRVSITSSTHSNREGKYVASLNLRDMVYTDTGTYRCSFNDSEDGSSIDSNTMIHLYVYDHVHLLTKDDFDFQQFVQYDTAVIPCMTTQPNVTVELKLQETIVPDNQYIQFNPKVGFLISPVLLEHTGIYTCQARFEGKTSEYKTQLIVRPKTSYVPPPHINKTSGEHVTTGQTLVLTCTITVDWSIQVRLSWSVPNTSKNVARIETPDPISRNVTLGGKPFKVVEQRLRISNAEQEDQGSYECVVTDHSGNSKSKREFIRIYERDQSFLNVWQEGSSTIQKPGGREETVQWVVNIQAHPPPRLTWFDPDGQIIPEGEDKEKGRILQTFPTAKDTRSMLKLKGLELESSGVYRVRVENEFEVKWENFTLIVTEPPQVSITVTSQPESGLFNLGEMYTLRCTARGYPRPRVAWTFVKCENYNRCEKRAENKAKTKETENGRFQVDSTLIVTASDSGRYTCIAHSGETAESSALNFFVTAVKDGFQISGEKKVLEGEKVEVKCTASRYNYSEDSISWYKQTVHGNQEISSVEDRSLEMYTDITRFDIVKGLKFKAIQTDNSGTYVCRARPPGPRRRHNLDAVLREDQIEIRVQAYEPPRLYSTNMYSNETLIFGKGEGVRLFCKVGGTHMPQVSWYKDGKPVTLNDNLKLVEKTQALIVGVVVEDIDEGEYSCEAENDKGKLTRRQRVVKVEPPSIHQTNLLGEMEAGKSRSEGNQAKLVDAGGSMLLQCRVLGRPRPTIIWRRNGAELDPARANITDGNQTLLLRNLRAEDAGKYECFVKNQGGTTAVFQNVEVQESSIMATIYATGIAIPVFIAVGIAVVLAIILILLAKLCVRSGRWKAPPTPPTPRLTQFDMPEDDQEAESCRLTLSRDGSPFGNGNVPVCHGCTGCQGSCHQCTACHYNFNGIYGCTTGPYGGNVMYSSGGGSILGVRGCGTPGPGYSAGSQLMNEFNMYSQHTLPSSRYNTIKREPSTIIRQDRRSASPRLSAEF